ncbi:putative membrane protein [Wickerhamomyces ciferrii]|uniref:Membrane protein n=1 Tax=Wickerhamomyces ciferrii (strain ATCC 14091 / BCRC 22168 / CBS 111 / JCM 3599 / NBRC 0793 / NRRL Y-1031 F-60-10) TaxID=1206466 RepID=K0KNI9_WICCF|nr:uncharacterized protein BN7_6404 [Wickerhamomyces ciferrii]CCH46805.1 putative membrane protein [Wickerhamomyces ciferrii]
MLLKLSTIQWFFMFIIMSIINLIYNIDISSILSKPLITTTKKKNIFATFVIYLIMATHCVNAYSDKGVYLFEGVTGREFYDFFAKISYPSDKGNQENIKASSDARNATKGDTAGEIAQILSSTEKFQNAMKQFFEVVEMGSHPEDDVDDQFNTVTSENYDLKKLNITSSENSEINLGQILTGVNIPDDFIYQFIKNIPPEHYQSIIEDAEKFTNNFISVLTDDSIDWFTENSTSSDNVTSSFDFKLQSTGSEIDPEQKEYLHRVIRRLKRRVTRYPDGNRWVQEHSEGLALFGTMTAVLSIVGGIFVASACGFMAASPAFTGPCAVFTVVIILLLMLAGLASFYFTSKRIPKHINGQLSKIFGPVQISPDDLTDELRRHQPSKKVTPGEKSSDELVDLFKPDGIFGGFSDEQIGRIIKTIADEKFKDPDQTDKSFEGINKSQYETLLKIIEENKKEIDDLKKINQDNNKLHDEEHDDFQKRDILSSIKNKFKPKGTNDESRNNTNSEEYFNALGELLKDKIEGDIFFANFDIPHLLKLSNEPSFLNFNFAFFKTKDGNYVPIIDLVPGGDYKDLGVKIALTLLGEAKPKEHISWNKDKCVFDKIKEHSFVSLAYKEDFHQNLQKIPTMEFSSEGKSSEWYLQKLFSSDGDGFSYCGMDPNEIDNSTGSHSVLSYILSISRVTVQFGKIAKAPTDCETIIQKGRNFVHKVNDGVQSGKNYLKGGIDYAFGIDDSSGISSLEDRHPDDESQLK